MQKRNKIQLVIALLLCAVSIIGAGLVQTDFGKIEMSDITIETPAGDLTAYLFKPDNGAKDQPAPAVVCLHGYLINREMQDANYVELARRGYVVLSLDGFAHGNSDVPSGYADDILVRSNGMSAAVEYLSALEYVDPAQIGVTGHSMGGQYSYTTMEYYTSLEEEALKNGADAAAAHKLNKVNTGVIVGNYPSGMAGDKDGRSFLCHANVIGATYDEFFFSNLAVLLTSDSSKNWVSNLTGTAVTADLEEGRTYVSPTTGYTITLYNPKQFHATNHFSVKCVKYLVESFERSMPAPKQIASSNQLWLAKELLNMVGLIGFFLLVVPLIDLFTSLPGLKAVRREVRTFEKPEKYVRRNIGTGIINSLLIVPVMGLGYVLLVNIIWPQDTTGGIALWAIACSLVILGSIKKPFKKQGNKLKGAALREELGTNIGFGGFLLVLVVSLLVAIVTYLSVFAADWINQTDYRIWSFDIRVFPASKILVALRYLPLFFGFYMMQSIAASRGTFNKDAGETKQVISCGIFNMIAPALLLIVTFLPTPLFQATTWVALFSAAGIPALATVFALIPILLLPVVPMMFITAAISVRSYRLTGNVWLAGIINTLLITMITVANTSFSYPY